MFGPNHAEVLLHMVNEYGKLNPLLHDSAKVGLSCNTMFASLLMLQHDYVKTTKGIYKQMLKPPEHFANDTNWDSFNIYM